MNQSIETSETSVDDLQDHIDKLILSIFEAVLKQQEFIHLNPSNDDLVIANSESIEIKQKTYKSTVLTVFEAYQQVKHSIISLKGINRTANEQRNELIQLSQDYQDVKRRVLQKESCLHELSSQIDTSLNQVYICYVMNSPLNS